MTLQGCILFYSLLSGIDPALTNAVIKVESNGNPFAVSRDRQDSGLMQVRAKYVPESKLQLLQSCTNVKRGIEILRVAKNKCKHTIDNTWLVCYNAGITGARRIRYPKKFPYYIKVTKAMQ
jgi:soluble lytic murein transglycosylase-like protein